MRPALLCALAALSVLRAGAQEPTVTLKGRHADAVCPPEFKPCAAALLRVADAAWEGYRDLYALPIPEPLHLRMRKVAGKGPAYIALWTDGQQSLFLDAGSETPLRAPAHGGAYNVYGICHELGHIVFYSRMRRVAGMPDGIGEGWAHYFGSVLTSRLFPILGEAVYPDPHNYHETSGLPRLERDIRRCEQTGRWDRVTQAARILFEVERRCGRKALADALNRTLARRPSGSELVPLLAESLTAVTGDMQAVTLFPDSFLHSEPRMQTATPDITPQALYRGMKLEWQADRLRLRYDDGKKAGERSLGGSGHGIIFCRPAGRWQITGVEFYGCRYGAAEPPEEEFVFTLLDERFRAIREVRVPYARFPRAGEWTWLTVAVPPTDAPARFYIVLDFDPTASKGIYVGLGSPTPRSHSRSALPGSHVADIQPSADWMIRCSLIPADRATELGAKEAVRKLQKTLSSPL